MKKVLIAGASGMTGSLILKYCLESSEVSEVISLVRKPSLSNHTKLKEVVLSDFKDYRDAALKFKNTDAAFFCIGVYTGQVPDDLFKEITVDYAVNFAKTLQEQSPEAKLCLLSGAGADRSEKSRTSFAKYKGMAENAISNLGLQFYTFRPGYIYPVNPRKEPSFLYTLMRALYPLIKVFGSNASIKSTELAQAMFNVGMKGAKQETLENRDILNYI